MSFRPEIALSLMRRFSPSESPVVAAVCAACEVSPFPLRRSRVLVLVVDPVGKVCALWVRVFAGRVVLVALVSMPPDRRGPRGVPGARLAVAPDQAAVR